MVTMIMSQYKIGVRVVRLLSKVIVTVECINVYSRYAVDFVRIFTIDHFTIVTTGRIHYILFSDPSSSPPFFLFVVPLPAPKYAVMDRPFIVEEGIWKLVFLRVPR